MHHNRRFVPVDKQLRLAWKSRSCRMCNFTLSPVLSVMNLSSDSSPFRTIDTFSSPGESAEGKHELISTPLTYNTSSTLCVCFEYVEGLETFAASKSRTKSRSGSSLVHKLVAWRRKQKHLSNFDASTPCINLITTRRGPTMRLERNVSFYRHVQRFKFASLIDCSACFRLPWKSSGIE